MKQDPVKKNMDKLHKPKTHKDKTKYDRKSESEKMQDELEPIDNTEPEPERVDDTFKRYAGYRDWNKTHDSYKILYAPDGRDEHGKKIKDD